jgi:xanthine dehydrogenase accessory factor
MSFALGRMMELAAGGPVARVVVAETRGSVPREVGAAMLVTADAVDGTIGGGALEYEAIARARAALDAGRERLDRMPLGPALGQCCGGSVTVLTEIWDAARLGEISGDVVARPLPGRPQAVPLAVSRALADARAHGTRPDPCVLDGWMVEPVARASRQVWVWGAGHVGRAIVGVLAPLPDLEIRWADSDRARFPDLVPGGVETLIAANPPDLVTLAPAHAEHLVLTYSHAIDLELCHRILGRPFRSLGLIGSATKWARFRSRLAALGHSETQIARITCPIGDPALGKHPQAIALGVAADIVKAGTGGQVMIGERA